VFYDNWELKIWDWGLTSLVSVISSFKFNKQFVENLFWWFLRQWKWKRVWLALRAWYFVPKSKISDKMEEWIIQEIINYLVEQGAKVILLPHSFHKTDNLANDFMFLSKFILRTENWELGTELIGNWELQEVYDVYRNKEIDFCFAMRLHSIILCQVYQIPFVGISYSTKTDEILKEF
jgi:polysaccharide pyruvyl transferase WcaK-like protein